MKRNNYKIIERSSLEVVTPTSNISDYLTELVLAEYGSLSLKDSLFIDDLMQRGNFKDLGTLQSTDYPMYEIYTQSFFLDIKRNLGFVVKYMEPFDRESFKIVPRLYGNPLIFEPKNIKKYFNHEKLFSFPGLVHGSLKAVCSLPLLPFLVYSSFKMKKVYKEDKYAGKGIEFLLDIYSKTNKNL